MQRMNNYNKKDTIFILWGTPITRGIQLAKYFNADLLPINFKIKVPLLIRYFFSMIKTFIVIFKKKPDIIICQIAPLFNALVAYLYTTFWGGIFLLDAHSAEIISRKWKFLLPLRKFLFKRAFYVFVHNIDNLETVKSWELKANVIVLNDPLPEVPVTEQVKNHNDGRKIVFITTFHYNEPYVECLKAAQILQKDSEKWKFIFTGNYKLGNLPFKPENTIFTGYTDYNKYWSILKGADVIVSLNKRDHVITCGVWESLALSKPTVTNNFSCVMDRFKDSFIYTDNQPHNIASAIEEAYSQKTNLIKKCDELKNNYKIEWNNKFKKILNDINK